MLNGKLGIVLCAMLISLWMMDVPAQSPLNAEELITLMKANKERFRSLELQFNKSTQRNVDQAPEVEGEVSILLLWTPNHSYSSAEGQSGRLHINQQCEWTKSWVKRLDRPTVEGDEPLSGLVTRNRSEVVRPEGHPLFDRVWTISGIPLDYFQKPNADVRWNEETKTYMMSLTVQGMTLSMEVDPSLGFMPRHTLRTFPDGKPATSTDFSDYQEVEPALWLPGKFVTHFLPDDPNESRVETIVLEHAVVNKPIDETQMRVIFPVGTRVDDRIVKENYIIGDENSVLSPAKTELSSSTISQKDLYAPPNERALSDTLAQAEIQVHSTIPFLPSRHVSRCVLLAMVILAIGLYLFVRMRSKSRADRKGSESTPQDNS